MKKPVRKRPTRSVFWRFTCCLVIFLAFLITPSHTFAQKQGNNWYFGDHAGVSFANGEPVALLDGKVSTNEGSAVISDADGKLLFYTDGIQVFDGSHHIMPNGNGLSGDPSSAQSAIIVPMPGSDTKYYIFTVAAMSPSKLDYSIVDMSLNDGNGDIVSGSKNIPVLATTEESVCAVDAGNFYWIITHNRGTSQYYAYKLTSSGLDIAHPVVTSIGAATSGMGDIGMLKNTASGSKVAASYYMGGRVEVLDFNKETGAFSNLITIPQPSAYGVEFSPDEKLLYAATYSGDIHQYNLTAPNEANVLASKYLVKEESTPGALQLGPNRKIYIADVGTQSLSVISDPNVPGAGCNYQSAAISLGGRNNMNGLPNYPSSFNAPPASPQVPAVGPAGVTAGLALWLDASDPNADNTAPEPGSPVTTWKDKSNSHNDASIVAGQTAAIYQENQINGKPALNFKRNSDYSGAFYEVAGLDIRASVSPDITVFSVYKPGAHTSSDFMGVWGNDNADWDRFFLCTWGQGANGAASFGPGNPPAADVFGSGTVGITKLLTAVYDGNVSDGSNNGPLNGSAIYFNGKLVASFTDHTHPTNAQTKFRIGYDGDNSAFNGDIAEVIVFKRKLNDCELQQINKYLGDKYGEDFSTSVITVSAGSTVICKNESITLKSSAGHSYKWLKDGTAIADATSSEYAATEAGAYQVVIETGEGCFDTSSVTTLTQSQLSANVTAAGDLEFCAGGSVELTAPAAANYEWYVNGYELSANTQNFTANESGQYKVRVTDKNGCSVTTSDKDAVNVTVNPAPNAKVYTEQPTAVCAGGSVTLNAAAGLSSYVWYRNDEKIAGANSDTYVARESGVYSVAVTTDKGCFFKANAESELAKSVIIHSSPVAELTASGALPCTGTATISAPAGMMSYVWKLNGNIIAANTPTIEVSEGGTYTVTVTDKHECVSSTKHAVTIKLDPTADCDADGLVNSIECPQGINCADRDGDGKPDYLDEDSDNDGRTDKIEGNSDCNKDGVADYLDDKPCSTGIVMPNLFSPNGDGQNDVIRPVVLDLKQFNGIKILNRWGNVVYESKDINQGWDGRLKGKMQPQDTYIWIATGITQDGKTVTYKGLFTLIK